MHHPIIDNSTLFHPQPDKKISEQLLTSPAICKLGMLIFLCSEVMLFGGLISAYLVLREASPSWPPHFTGIDLPALPKLLTGINTVILVSSSFVYHFAENEVKKGKLGTFYILLSAIMGATFIGLQAVEWTTLYHEGLWFNKGGVYGSTFFTLTGFHGVHVCIGVCLILWCFYLQITKGVFTAQRHVALANVGLYWHFVDIVWIFLYTILYIL